MNVIGVYNAEGTFIGELTYTINKLLGRSSCALCEITHGWYIGGKNSWKESCQSSFLTISLLHLENLNADQYQTVSQFPAFIIYYENRWVELMNASDIARFKNDSIGLIRALEAKIPSLKTPSH